MSPQEGIKLAREQGLDLIEVSPDAKPPVCRIYDFGKFLYQIEKQEKQAKKKHHVMHNKEVKLSPKIQEHDYQTKLRSAVKFLTRGDKVKLSMYFRGREISHLELGERILERFIQDTSDISMVEKRSSLENRSLFVALNPKPGSSKKKTKHENEGVESHAETKNEQSSTETI